MRMINLQSSLVKRYFNPLDKFLILRVFSTKEVNRLFQSTNINNKKEYINLVLNACIVDFTDKVFPEISKLTKPQESLADLYRLCISVNPFLDIDKVAIPLSSEDRSVLHLLEARKQPAEIDYKVKHIKERLAHEIVGQELAINSIDRALKRSVLGLRNTKKPVAVLLFVGRTGVGKTELAKVLTTQLYDSSSRLLRINCSEYSLAHEYAKLLGAPPGYVGYDESGILSQHILANPEMVTLFDEIEKADNNIHNLLLQIMDDGYAQDSKGRLLDFTKGIIILTSNVGTKEVEGISRRIGFVNENMNLEKINKLTKEALKDRFKPEFLNRINDIIVFNPLTIDHCVKIVEKFLNEIGEYTSRLSIELKYAEDLPEFIVNKGFSSEYGARELRRVVDEVILNPLSDQILDKKFKPGDIILVKVRRGAVNFLKN